MEVGGELNEKLILSSQPGRGHGGQGSDRFGDRFSGLFKLNRTISPDHAQSRVQAAQQQSGIQANSQHAETLVTPFYEVFRTACHNAAILPTAADCVLD